jgi:hypothetical protein
MALSTEEERILTEIAAGLGREDPRLAARLAGFGRRRRVRATVAVVIAALVAAGLLVMAFAMVPS